MGVVDTSLCTCATTIMDKLKVILTAHSEEFGSRVAFYSMLLSIIMEVFTVLSVTLEIASYQWAMMAGGICILLMILVVFFIVYKRVDKILIGAHILLIIIIILCIAAVANEGYLLWNFIGDDTATYWAYTYTIVIALAHVVVGILAGINLMYSWKLWQITKLDKAADDAYI